MYALDTQITQTSDVYQLAAVFWLVVNMEHPSGVLTRDDWHGLDRLFDPIFTAIQHDPANRQQNGTEFNTAIEEAII